MKTDKKALCNTFENVDELRQILTPEQFKVVMENGTEAPFTNKYWDNHHPGVYLDIISQKPLFSSKDKFDSRSGWPSFSEPIVSEEIIEKFDYAHGMTRTEVRSATGNGHLGHVFDDGPVGRGMRYCINSAALRFVPLEKLEEEGLGEYLKLFSEEEIQKACQKPFCK